MEIEAKKLSQVLKMIAPAIKPNPTIPAFEGVRIDRKSLTAGNSQLMIRLPFENTLPECILDFPTLSKTANTLTGNLSLKESEKVVLFQSKTNKVNVPVIDKIEAYPTIKPVANHPDFTLTKPEVIDIAALNVFITNKDRFPAIYFNGRYFAATNGVFGGFYDRGIDKEVDMCFYPELFSFLAGFEADEYLFTKGYIKCQKEGQITAAVNYLLLSVDMMPFDNLRNAKTSKRAYADTASLQSMLDLLMIGVNTSANIGTFTFKPDFTLQGMTEFSEVNKKAEGEISCSLIENVTEDLIAGLEIKQLQNILKFIGSEEVIIEFEGGNTFFFFKAENSLKSCLTAPCKI